MDTSTYRTLYLRKNGSLAALAESLQESPGVLSDILNQRHDHVSLTAENRVRGKLGLRLLPHLVAIMSCPSCGGAHVLADCHGAPVAEVVALAPGESVRKPGKARARRRYLRPCLPVDPVARVARLRWLLGVAEAEARQAAPDATREIGQTYTWQPGGWVAQYAAAVEGD